MVTLQQLSDAGLNPFAVQLLWESWERHKTSPRAPVAFPFQGAVISIEPAEAYLARERRWRVFYLNECEWWLAQNLEQAIEEAMRQTGLPRDEVAQHPYELSQGELARLRFKADDGTKRSFAAELERRIAAGPRVECFASTEC